MNSFTELRSKDQRTLDYGIPFTGSRYDTIYGVPFTESRSKDGQHHLWNPATIPFMELKLIYYLASDCFLIYDCLQIYRIMDLDIWLGQKIKKIVIYIFNYLLFT